MHRNASLMSIPSRYAPRTCSQPRGQPAPRTSSTLTANNDKVAQRIWSQSFPLPTSPLMAVNRQDRFSTVPKPRREQPGVAPPVCANAFVPPPPDMPPAKTNANIPCFHATFPGVRDNDVPSWSAPIASRAYDSHPITVAPGSLLDATNHCKSTHASQLITPIPSGATREV